jgi:glycosyltransferase involved in cell wall biosynthesis
MNDPVSYLSQPVGLPPAPWLSMPEPDEAPSEHDYEFTFITPQPTVSVILPTFNRSRTLATAIASVLNQTYRDFELIVVDDGSVDESEALVARIKDKRLKYIKRPRNGGAGAARNTGLLAAAGEYIAFQDSDDIWLPNKLERQLGLFATLPAEIGVVTGAKILYGRDDSFAFGPGRVSYLPPPKGVPNSVDESPAERILWENRISLQNTLFRMDCYPDRAWFDSLARANEDWEFAVRLARHTQIHEDGEPVVLGFVSSDSISRNKRKESTGLLRILKKNRDILQQNPKLHATLLLHLARLLHNSGKKRVARRLLLASILLHPTNVREILASMINTLKRRCRGPESRRAHKTERGPA